jgi:hypothetical protein
MDTDRTNILNALALWIGQRPGLDPRDYISDWRDKAGHTAYRHVARKITRDLNDARELLRYVKKRESITGAMLCDAFKRGFSGRLSWDGENLDYCTGQYWPTEYRAAACAVLAAAVWDYLREGRETGDDIRRAARREFSRAIAKRWFDA